jgi:hypothetical protein
MSKAQSRRWTAWEDYMREWCRREDFRNALPELLPGEDEEFAAYLGGLVDYSKAPASPARTL